MIEVNPNFNPICMPLSERPVPKILENYLRTNMPFGYGGTGTAYTVTYQRALFVVGEVFEAPDGPDLMLRWFATRNTIKRGFEITEVMRKSPAEPYCYYRNAFYRHLSGWNFVYRDETKKSRGGYYGYNYTLWEKGMFNKWIPESLKKAPGFTAHWINPEIVATIPRYRFSGWCAPFKGHLPVIQYLQMYNENKGVEFFGKLGIMPTKGLIQKATKDGNFRRFLRDHAPDVRYFGATVTLFAYNHHCDFIDAYEEINGKARAAKKISGNCWEAKELSKHFDKRKIWEYAEKVGPRNYNDYLNAAKFLQLDLSDTKVAFPKEFKRMHDLRINEAAEIKAKQDAEKARIFEEKFAAAAADYMFANYANPGEAYVVMIPVLNSQLVDEGNALHHCVGRMGYGNRMIEHKSFIAFLRKADEVDKPFVTIEFNLESKKIVQIYGAHDHRPDADVVAWASSWENIVRKILEKANKKLETDVRNGKKSDKSLFEYIREMKLAA